MPAPGQPKRSLNTLAFTYCFRATRLSRLCRHVSSDVQQWLGTRFCLKRPLTRCLLLYQLPNILNCRDNTQCACYGNTGRPARIDFPRRRLPKTRRNAALEEVKEMPANSTPSEHNPTANNSGIVPRENRPLHAKPRRSASDKELERELSHIAHSRPYQPSIRDILHILIKDRHVRPTALHYEANILSSCDAAHGSAEAVEATLQEMERESMAIGTSIMAASFKVLAIHPDYILRSSILSRAQDQWVTLSPSDHEHVVLGLLREGQLELAYRKIQDTQAAYKGSVPMYIYSLLIYKLCEVTDFDAVLRTLYYLYDERLNLHLSTYTWYHVLDAASARLHVECTKYVWRHMVEPFYINPSTGICYNILLTAARAGDVDLAEGVGKLLAHRRNGGPSLTEVELKREAYRVAGKEEGVQIRKILTK